MKKILGIILLVIGMSMVIHPVVFWAKNPELTQMQVSIETWPYAVAGFITATLGFYLFLKDKIDSK
jgi:uncharacterized membrane protein YfcA